MGRIVIGGAVGGFIFYIWGMLSWMVLHLHDNSYQSLPNGAAMADQFRAAGWQTGIYFFPGYDANAADHDAEMKRFTELHERGPIGMIAYRAEGSPVMAPLMMAKGLAVDIAGGLLMSVVLLVAGRGAGYGGRVIIGLCMAAFAAVTTHGAYLVWMGFPLNFTLAMAADVVIGWTLAVVAMAGIVRPKQQAA